MDGTGLNKVTAPTTDNLIELVAAEAIERGGARQTSAVVGTSTPVQFPKACQHTFLVHVNAHFGDKPRG